MTRDLDVLHVHPGSDAAVAAAAARVAAQRDWDATWLHFEVTRVGALPTMGRAVEWETLYDKHGIVMQVAAKEPLLAIKLRANRPGRDTRDVRMPLALCDITTVDTVDALVQRFDLDGSEGAHTAFSAIVVRTDALMARAYASDPNGDEKFLLAGVAAAAALMSPYGEIPEAWAPSSTAEAARIVAT